MKSWRIRSRTLPQAMFGFFLSFAAMLACLALGIGCLVAATGLLAYHTIEIICKGCREGARARF